MGIFFLYLTVTFGQAFVCIGPVKFMSWLYVLFFNYIDTFALNHIPTFKNSHNINKEYSIIGCLYLAETSHITNIESTRLWRSHPTKKPK